MSSGSGSNNNASNSKRGQSGRRVKIESTSSDADYDTTPDHNFEHGSWECTVCTFRNKSEAFRCEMCDVRKGTSTRKPRLNSTVVEQQQTVQKFVQQQQMAMMAQVQKEKSRDRNSLNPSCQSSLQDIDSPGPSYRSIESPASGASTSLGPQSPCTSKTPTPQPTPPPLVVSSISTSLTPSPTISIPNSNSIVTPLKHHRSNVNNKSRRGRGGKNFFLNNLDQNSARTLAVTVNGVTVVITDYKLLTSNETNDNNSSLLKSSDPTVSPPASDSPVTAKRTNSSKKKTSSSSSKKRKKLIIADDDDDDDDNAVESSADESNDDKRIKNKKNKKKTFAKPSSCHFNNVDDDEDSNCAT